MQKKNEGRKFFKQLYFSIEVPKSAFSFLAELETAPLSS